MARGSIGSPQHRSARIATMSTSVVLVIAAVIVLIGATSVDQTVSTSRSR
jgi:hypothetical protein